MSIHKASNIITGEQIETLYDKLNIVTQIFLSNVIKFFTTMMSYDYVVYQSNYPELVKIGGDRFKDIVTQLFWNKYKKSFEHKYLQFVIDNVKHNFAGFKEAKDVNNRIFHDKQNNEIVYLLKSDNTAVKVDKTGFQVFNNTEVIFADETGMLPQALPRRGVTMEEFHRALDTVLAIESLKKLNLVKIYIVACYLDIMMPHLYLLGVSGSSKTYLSKTIRKIVAPNKVLLNSAFARDELNRVLFNSSPIIVLNNLSEINSQLNDSLCNIYDSGAGTIIKKLYSNTDKVIIPMDSKVIISSNSMIIKQYSLIDRVLLIKMSKVKNPIDEDILNQRFSSHIETILGGIFMVLSKVMDISSRNEYNHFSTTDRLVSFEFWGGIIAEAMEIPRKEFEQTFRETRIEGIASFCANFPEAVLIAKYLEEHDELKGTAEQIIAILKEMDDAEEETLATNPATFSRKLNEYSEVMDKLEIKVEKTRGKSRNIIMTKVAPSIEDEVVATVSNSPTFLNYEKNKENSDVPTATTNLFQNEQGDNENE